MMKIFPRNLKSYGTLLLKIVKNRANDFKTHLNKNIEDIPGFPYKYRQSRWFDNETIRDLIFKGYTIPYVILDDKIVILDIFKWNK